MKQIILCIGCGKQVGCRTENGVKICEECNNSSYCYVYNNDGISTESFITCERCRKRFENFDE